MTDKRKDNADSHGLSSEVSANKLYRSTVPSARAISHHAPLAIEIAREGVCDPKYSDIHT